MERIPLAEWLDQIVCGDALEILPRLPANSVDLVLTDPPWLNSNARALCRKHHRWRELGYT